MPQSCTYYVRKDGGGDIALSNEALIGGSETDAAL